MSSYNTTRELEVEVEETDKARLTDSMVSGHFVTYTAMLGEG